MRKILFITITFFLSMILLVVLSEIILRITGFQPWTYIVLTNEPTMHEPDHVLGWKNKEGKYIVSPYVPSGKDIHISFLSDGRRNTGTKQIDADANGEIIIVGGSYTQGWAISDDETFPWKLQRHYPSLKVINYGTGGYGTYQSLLVLERELPRLKSPVIVLYGFNQFHESRNVALQQWSKSLSKGSKRGHVYLPYVTLDDKGVIIRHLPERYLKLPFNESLAVVAFIESVYMKVKTRHRTAQKRLVTQSLILEMNRVSKQHDAKFAVVMLSASKDYITFLQANNISVINCAYPIISDMRVPGEGHPNGVMNTIWYECIANELGEQINILSNP